MFDADSPSAADLEEVSLARATEVLADFDVSCERLIPRTPSIVVAWMPMIGASRRFGEEPNEFSRLI
jgi:hypothetical protein